jgi:hypothetical protein
MSGVNDIRNGRIVYDEIDISGASVVQFEEGQGIVVKDKDGNQKLRFSLSEEGDIQFQYPRGCGWNTFSDRKFQLTS